MRQAKVGSGADRAPKDLESQLVRLRDPDWNVRYTASRALVELGEEAVDSLIVLLEEDDHYLRGQAAMCLGAIRDSRAVSALVTVLDDPNGAVRQEAVRALGMIGESAVDPLLAVVREGTVGARRAAIQALTAVRNVSARQALEVIARDMDETPAVRWEAKLAVNRLRERPRV